MSSQLQGKAPTQAATPTNPYANIPGYRTDEPANSAWNRTILAYKSAGVPYSIERTETPTKTTSVKDSSSSLGQVSGPQKSTNPELESALLESFSKNPEGFTSTNYFKGLFEKGVLTSSDYDKLTDIVTKYNANVDKQNEKNLELNQQTALGNGLISLSNKQIAAKNIQSGKEFSDFLQTYEKQNATFQIIDKTGKTVATTSGARSYYDVLAAQKQFGQVKVQPILPSQQQAEKPFSIKEYVAGGISGFQKALTTGKEPSAVNYFIDVGKGAASFFYQGAKQLAATAPIIGQELFSTITTGRTNYQIKGATPISGFAASFLQPSLGFTPAQQSQYQTNIKSIDNFIGSVKSQAKQQGLVVPSGILTPKEGSAGAAIGGIIGIGLSLYGTKELAPIRYEKYALPLGETKTVITKTLTGAPAKEEVPVFSTVYKGLTFGYGAGKPVIGSYSGKIALGLKPELLKYPQAAASGTRFELGTGSGFETKVFQSDKTQAYLKEQGLLPERTQKAVDLGIRITKESAKTPEVQFQKGYSFTQEPFLKLQGKEQQGALEFLVSRQSFVKQAGKGTQIGRVHGSLSEIPVAVPELALKAHDIDVRVSNDILGEKTAKGLSEHLNLVSAKERFLPGGEFEFKFNLKSRATGEHVLGTTELSGDVVTGVKIEKNPFLRYEYGKNVGFPYIKPVKTSVIKQHELTHTINPDLSEAQVLALEKESRGIGIALGTIGERRFVSSGKTVYVKAGPLTKELTGSEEKIAEFLNMEKAVEYSSATQSSERVFGQKLPTGFKRYSISPGGPKLKVTPGRFQTLRRSASVFSLKGEKNPVTGKYEFNVGPEEHRLKDVAKLYSRQLSEAQANFAKGSKARAFRQQSQARELKDIFGKQIDVEKYIMEERLGLTKPEPIEAEAGKSSGQQFKDISSGVFSSSKNITLPTAISSGSPSSKGSSRNINDISRSSSVFSKFSSKSESGISKDSKSSKISKFSSSFSSQGSKFKQSQGSKPSSSTSKTFSSISSPSGSPSKSPYSTLSKPPSNSPSLFPPSNPPSSPPSKPPSSPPSNPPYYPPQYPPGKKRIPDFPFGLDTTNGPGGPVGGSGNTKAFVGNVPEFQFTGMFNRIETKYGKGGAIPRAYKVSKTPARNSFSTFSRASGQGKNNIKQTGESNSFTFGKISNQGKSKQSKPLSNKFNRLI